MPSNILLSHKYINMSVLTAPLFKLQEIKFMAQQTSYYLKVAYVYTCVCVCVCVYVYMYVCIYMPPWSK